MASMQKVRLEISKLEEDDFPQAVKRTRQVVFLLIMHKYNENMYA